jgi:hypothetical protein
LPNKGSPGGSGIGTASAIMIKNEEKKETNQAAKCLDIKNPSSVGVI